MVTDADAAVDNHSTIDRKLLSGLYARLTGIRDALIVSLHLVPLSLGTDYNEIVGKLADVLGEDTGTFRLDENGFYRDRDRRTTDTVANELRAKLSQLLSYLEKVHFAGESVARIGALYNALTDPDMRERCSDLLSAPDKFDRAVREATVVLEDRIRRKSAFQDRNVAGADLVNRVIKSDPKKSILVLDTDPSIQAGLANSIRGIMQSYRNPVHHHLSDLSRTRALKICGFIDELLYQVDAARLQTAP